MMKYDRYYDIWVSERAYSHVLDLMEGIFNGWIAEVVEQLHAMDAQHD